MKYLLFCINIIIFCVVVRGNLRFVDEIPANNSLYQGNVSAVDEVLAKWRNFESQIKTISMSIYKNALPLMVKTSQEINISPACSRGIMKMLSGIKQMKTWAYQMIDSSGKFPNGILGSSFTSFGEYDMCLDINVPGNFQGQYCSIVVLMPLPRRRPFTPSDQVLPEFVNFTDPSTVTSLFVRNADVFYLLNLRTSVCVPSVCSVNDIQAIASTGMKNFRFPFEVEVQNCEYKQDVILSESEIVIVCVLAFIVALGIISTVIDVAMKLTAGENSKREISIPLRCLFCFSFYTNTKRLLKKDDSPDTIKIFHGMKVVTLLWVMLNHTYYYENFQAVGNLSAIPQWRRRISFQVIANGFLNVETFFFITAVLVAYAVTKMKPTKLNVFLYIFRRFWRLTPPFMLVIATSFLVPHLGSGPIWQETVVKGLIEKCKKNWWANLIYINNFVPISETCFSWMWYLAADTHLYILALMVIIPLQRNVRLAFIMNGILFTMGIFATIANNVYYQLTPTAITAYTHPEDGNYFADNGYFRSYLHISTYCVGLSVGHIIATRKNLKIPLVANICGWLLAFMAALTVLYGVYDWNQGNVPGLAVSTLYTCTNKLVWSLSLGWVTIACVTGNGGIATTILRWRAFVPLSRLTYMAYLIHPVIQFMYIGSTRVLIQADNRTVVYIYVGHVVFAYMSAYVFSLLFESPFMSLEKILLSRKETKLEDNHPLEKKDMEKVYERSWKSISLNPKSRIYSVQ